MSDEIAEEREEGRAEGEQQTTLAAIKNVMSSFGISVDKAMDSLKIPKEKRGTYLSLLG